MVLEKLKIIEKLLPIILKAQNAKEEDLKLLRQRLIQVLEEIGPKQFVSVAADILKDNFKVEGCNDARIPLKRIFSVSLEEVDEALSKKDFGLPEEHPISQLAHEHGTNMDKLKSLSSLSGRIRNHTFEGLSESQVEEFTAYFSELDTHIRKEEEVLFPALEAKGMKEHPDNLKEEHKRFRKIISEVISALEESKSGRDSLVYEKISAFLEEFVPEICNHIFRETYIFYPAALEFIQDESLWDEIRNEFNQIAVG